MPTTQNTAPARKPLRFFLFWSAHFLIFAPLLITTPTVQATSFQLWASSTTLRSPAGADELKTISRPNGTETNRTYDQAGRLASITVSQGAVTVSQRVYTFDRNGNRLTQVEKNGGAEETSTYE